MDTITQIYRKAYVHRKIILLFTKIFVAFLLAYAIYSHLFVKSDFDEIKAVFLQQLQKSEPIYLILVFFLMPINWILESKKWQQLVRPFQHLSFQKSIYGVLTGTCLGIITPGRLGEYGGRLFYINEENRLLAVRATFVGSVIQNIINVGIGFLCLLLLQSRLDIVGKEDMNMLWMISLGIFSLVILAFLFHKKIIHFLQKKIPAVGNKLNELVDFSMYNWRLIANIGLLSLVRYLIYVSQYMLIIHFFEVTDDTFSSLLGVGVIYLFQTLLPLPPMLSIFARGEIAIIIWSYFSSGVLGVLAATFSLWVINLMIPAIVGYLLLLRIRVK